MESDMGEEPIAGGRGVKERLCILWECPHCGYRNILAHPSKGLLQSAQNGSQCDSTASSLDVANVSIVSQQSSRIIAAVPPQKRWKLKQLARQNRD